MNILVTGGNGMVGSAFQNLETNHNLTLVGSSQYDLRKPLDVAAMMRENCPDTIIHLAARVGGVKGNTDFVADFFSDNILINTNVLEAARREGIKKVVSLLSTCVYPNNVSYPLTEDQIHNGEPHQSNFGYAYAKRMLEVHSRAIRHQYGLKYITAIPNNLYGLNDNFDLQNGHVIPSIIRKVWESKQTGTPPEFWGSGQALREFTYSEDLARALIWMVENYSDPQPLNIGNPGDISIYNLVTKIQGIMNVSSSATWDLSKPEGQYKKPSSNKRFMELAPDFEYTTLDRGLEKTIAWFLKEHPNVRGI